MNKFAYKTKPHKQTKVKNENIKRFETANMAILGQILVECNTQSEISNTIQYIIQLLGGGGLSRLVGGKKLRRKKTIRKRKLTKKSRKYKH